MTEERFKDIETRMRKVEDFILGQLNMLLELSQSLKGRVDTLEDNESEFKSFIHTTCTLKDKEIAKAREESISISTDYTDKQHKQTWIVVAFIITTMIALVVYFNIENNHRALDIQKNDTQIENMRHTLDRIDSKLDKLSEHMEYHK